jgi:hypothetical protein
LRIEFEIGRTALSELELYHSDEVLAAAPSLWRYCTGEWLTLRTPTTDSNSSRWAAKAAGCEGAGIHDLRRLNATSLVVSGVDVKTAQVRLGHADPRMTLSIYASAPAAADRAAAQAVSEQFFGALPTKRAQGARRGGAAAKSPIQSSAPGDRAKIAPISDDGATDLPVTTP